MTMIPTFLKGDFKTALASTKTVDNRDARFLQFAKAVMTTQRVWGGQEELECVAKEFKLLLKAKNSWGKNEVLDQLDIAIERAENA